MHVYVEGYPCTVMPVYRQLGGVLNRRMIQSRVGRYPVASGYLIYYSASTLKLYVRVKLYYPPAIYPVVNSF